MIQELASVEHMNGTQTLYAFVQDVVPEEMAGTLVETPIGPPRWVKVRECRYGDPEGDRIRRLAASGKAGR